MSKKTAIEILVWHMENESIELKWEYLKEAMQELMKDQLEDAFRAGTLWGYYTANDAVNPNAKSFDDYYKERFQE